MHATSILDDRSDAGETGPGRVQPADRDARVPRWTELPARQLWQEWLRRFGDDEDRALDAALNLADRLASEHSVKQQDELRRIKQALLRDAFSEPDYLAPVEPEERTQLPLPFHGVLKVLTYVAVQRAGFRPWDRRG